MMHKKNSPESGFSLVELAVVLGIAGFILAGAMAMMKPYVEMAQRNTTKMKQENIAKALSEYALQYGRLPCPGAPNPTTEPYGSPRNSGINGDITTNPCSVTGYVVADHNGIVPFKALGLSEDNVKDAWGNLMRYAVTNMIAGYDPPGTYQGRLHDQCRTQAWIDSASNKNQNINKAKLCCTLSAGTSTNDLVVMDNRAGGVSYFPFTHTNNRNNYYGDPNVLKAYPTSLPIAADFFENRFIAYVLISHGKNGDGAFIGQTNNTKPATVPGGTVAQEYENREPTPDRTFVSREYSTRMNNDYFDDIVLWRTNHQLVSELGNNSCARP